MKGSVSFEAAKGLELGQTDQAREESDVAAHRSHKRGNAGLTAPKESHGKGVGSILRRLPTTSSEIRGIEGPRQAKTGPKNKHKNVGFFKIGDFAFISKVRGAKLANHVIQGRVFVEKFGVACLKLSHVRAVIEISAVARNFGRSDIYSLAKGYNSDIHFVVPKHSEGLGARNAGLFAFRGHA